MPLKTGDYLRRGDVYIDYPYEEVMFRTVRVTGAVYRRFYGEKEGHEEIPENNRLFNDTILIGYEITAEEYEIDNKEW
ncbi:hypothetical protein [Marinimicrobium agarilyticum]|uniref:hypothetical protein n=1 Tax=Marinimicrobium agarilyticum TaxID=306546 RepID=UPI000488EA17|nr:hypothetical protein [Marinimicrobium agarilyticum]